MLVDCPKCGFSQPQDQYCAKCGVDMQSYRPKLAPVQTRLFANPVFHIGLVFILVFSGALYIIREQRSQEITRRLDYLKNGPLYAESLPGREPPPPAQAPAGSNPRESASTVDSPPPAPNDSQMARSGAPTSPPPPSPAAMAAMAVRNDGTQETELASLNTDAAADAAPKAKAVTVKTYYALAPRNRLVELIETSRRQSQFIDFGEFQMGTLRDIKTYLNRLDVMESVQRKFEAGLGEQMWFVGDRNIEPQIGLTTKIGLRGLESGNLRGEIELLRSLHESNDFSQAAVAKAFGPGDFVVPPQAGLLIILNLPRVPQYDETSMTPTQFLRIFRMPDFKQKQSEFVMLVDFE